ncbi:MAG: hypothetical protein KJ736_06800 [Candidatus Omnitrophica bacterium]|nr:hypothetical protein [Candidatus Omnitrophota bacterium]
MLNNNKYILLFLVVIVLVNVFVLSPSLYHNARGDHIYYLVETSGLSSFWSILKYSYAYTRTRVFATGDKILFRPLFYAVLSIEKYLFGYNFIYWQLTGIVLHILVLLQLYRITKFFGHKFLFLLIALNFSVQFISQEMIIWHHINAYMIFSILFLEAFYHFIEYIKDPSERIKKLFLVAFYLTLACLIFEFGIICNLIFAMVVVCSLITEKGRSKRLVAKARTLLIVLLPSIIYTLINVLNYVNVSGQQTIGRDFGIFNFAKTIQHFINIVWIYVRSNILIFFTNLDPLGRVTMLPMTWSNVKSSFISNQVLSVINVIFVLLIILISVRLVSEMLKDGKKSCCEVSQDSKALGIAFIISFSLAFLYLFLLTAARPSTTDAEYAYITNALYHFYNVSLFSSVALYLLFVSLYENIFKQNKGLYLMIILALCISIFLNGYKSYEFNSIMKDNDSSWGKFIIELNNFVKDHKREKDFSFDVGYTEKTRRGVFIIGDPQDGKKVVGSVYSMLFGQYIKGVESKYLIVYTNKEGFRAFIDKDEAIKAMNEHLSKLIH